LNSQAQNWFCLQSGPGAPDYNMSLDEALLELAPELGRPILRFYSWSQPAASFGYSQKYRDVAAVTLLRPLVRRPTGGGLVGHDADWTYSLVFPPHHFWYGLKAAQSYQRVHQWLLDAFSAIGVPATLAPCSKKEIPGQCFVGAEQFDVLWHGRKIAGAAQRRTRTGLLIQGSVQPPPLSLARGDWESAMRRIASAQLGVEWIDLELAGGLIAAAQRLQTRKYSQDSFNQRR
jgi:lipoate-protein ligase A